MVCASNNKSRRSMQMIGSLVSAGGRLRSKAGVIWAVDWAEGKLAVGDPDRNVVLSEPWDAEHHGITPQFGDEEGKGLCVIADLQRDDGKVSDSAGCDWSPVDGFQGAGFTEWGRG